MKKTAIEELAEFATTLDKQGAYEEANEIDKALECFAFGFGQMPPALEKYVDILQDEHADINHAIQAYLALQMHGVDVAVGHLEELGVSQGVISAIQRNFNNVKSRGYGRGL